MYDHGTGRELVMTEVLDGLVRTRKAGTFSEEVLGQAGGIFRRLRERGVIRGGSFEDSVWALTNETDVFRLRFPDDEKAYLAGAGTWTGVPFEGYVQAMKAFLLLQTGSVSLQGLRDQLHELSLLTEDPDPLESGFEPSPASLRFLGFLSGGHPVRDHVSSGLEDLIVWKRRGHARRDLAGLSDYLRFDRELDAFWQGSTPDEKLRWFPIRLWWELTCILPLRPTELLVTPWDCVRQSDGQYYLTIRRTKLKKRKGSLGYRVVTDYSACTYEVPAALAEEILWYKAAVTAAMGDDQDDPCRNRDTDKDRESGTVRDRDSDKDKSKGRDALRLSYLFGGSRPLPYQDARLLLRSFLGDVLGWEDVSAIHLGDTRHLSMIGLIISGGSPVICRELAGHESVDIASHYYTNTSRIVRSASYFFTRDRGKSCSLVSASFRMPPEGASLHPVPGGMCGAPQVLSGDISECMRNIPAGGSPGDCAGCPWFYPDRDHLHRAVSRPGDDASSDAPFLFALLDRLRKGQGMTCTFREALDRELASSARHFPVPDRNGEEYERKGPAPQEGKEDGHGKKA